MIVAYAMEGQVTMSDLGVVHQYDDGNWVVAFPDGAMEQGRCHFPSKQG